MDTTGFPDHHGATPPPSALGRLYQQALETARGGGDPPDLTAKQLAVWAQRFSAEEIDALIIPKRTLARRKAKGEALSLEESDRAYRLAHISAEADRVFANPDKADRWLRRPNPVFGAKPPLELLKSEAGARAVEQLLGQIDHGMFV